MAIQMQINKTPTPCPGRAGGSSSWRAESALLGGPAPAPAPRSHMKGNDSVLEVPSFRKKPQKSLPFITPSLVLPRVSILELNLEEQLSHQEEKVPIVSSLFQPRLFLGCSSRFGGSAASRVPGGSGLLSGLQGELLWEPGSSRATPPLPAGRAQGCSSKGLR